jgi:hypothetical protein
MWLAPGNSRTTGLCNPFLSNGTVNTSTIIGVLYGFRAEGLEGTVKVVYSQS